MAPCGALRALTMPMLRGQCTAELAARTSRCAVTPRCELTGPENERALKRSAAAEAAKSSAAALNKALSTTSEEVPAELLSAAMDQVALAKGLVEVATKDMEAAKESGTSAATLEAVASVTAIVEAATEMAQSVAGAIAVKGPNPVSNALVALALTSSPSRLHIRIWHNRLNLRNSSRRCGRSGGMASLALYG